MTKETGYTTKPIELPLSTEKEYVLVDVSGYTHASIVNHKLINRFSLKNPFELDYVVNGGDGMIEGEWVITKEGELEFFHEVIRNVHLKTETPEEKEVFYGMENNSESPNGSWWDGEGLPPVGAECEFQYPEGRWNAGYYHGKTKSGKLNLYIIEYKDGEVVTLGGLTKFRPIETPEQKEERERLEAGKELYELYMSNWDTAYISWDGLDNKNKSAFLSIVEKTGYRKNA
jgi:hypothetical protein